MELKPNQIFIEMLEDGSWQGSMIRHGSQITCREAAPEYVLTTLLTHPGEKDNG